MTDGREEVLRQLTGVGFLGDPQLALVLMREPARPLLLEGEAGVGNCQSTRRSAYS